MLSLISVVIPLYNREATIQRAIDSVLNQTYSNIEVLVVDDGSTDHSVKMLEKYQNDKRVKIICQDTNRGANAARNKGICEAKGEYIAFQDSDDEWLPNKLEKQIKVMKEQKFYICFCSFKRHYPQTTQVVPNCLEHLTCEMIKERLKNGNIIGTPTLVVHRDVIKNIGVFDEEMPRLQDYEFVLRIAKKYNICFVNEPLVMEYQTDGCISLNNQSLHKAYALLLKKHSDFINIDYIWGEYLNTDTEIFNTSIDWARLNATIEWITTNNAYCTKELLYKSTINQMNQKYLRIRQYAEQKYNFFLDTIENRKFVIYGAGFYARQIIETLKVKNLQPKCFVVTEVDGTEIINNIPVIPLSQLHNTELTVIIAVSGNAQKKIIESLLKKGINRYYIYPNCI